MSIHRSRSQNHLGPQGNTAQRQAETQDSVEFDQPIPRKPRRNRRAKTDRGLPPDAELFKLAADYCEHQAKLWPQLAKRGLLPSASPETISAMVADLKSVTGPVTSTHGLVPSSQKLCLKIGGSYNRYSCDNSSPTSINDQLVDANSKGMRGKAVHPVVVHFLRLLGEWAGFVSTRLRVVQGDSP